MIFQRLYKDSEALANSETKMTVENKNRSKERQKKRKGQRKDGEKNTREHHRRVERPPERSLLLLIIYPLKTSLRL